MLIVALYCRSLLSGIYHAYQVRVLLAVETQAGSGCSIPKWRKNLGRNQAQSGGHFSSGQMNQEFNSRLHKSQIVQRTHLIPVVFCRW